MLEISRSDISAEELTEYPAKDRFITLPIENYLNILEIEPIKPQIALINAINSPKYRFVTAALSRRTGKTYASNIVAQLVALMPDKSILIMSPNYNLSQISWDLQKRLLNRFEIELTKANAKDKILEISNNSSIRMGSISQADSVVGRSYDLILFDEAALDDKGKDVFNIQLRPTLDKLNSKAIFISTPRGKNWFHEFFMRGYSDETIFEEWASIHSDYKENPRVSEKDIEQARGSMSSAEFNQEYLADFVVMQGQIWNYSDECILEDFDPSSVEVFDVIAGLDIGFKDDTAFVVLLTDGVNFYLVDEYQQSGKTTTYHAEQINKLIDKWNIDFIYIDSAAQQTKYDLAMNFDISTINANKSLLDGIGYVASIIENRRFFIDSTCKQSISTLDNYVWDDREGLLKEKPKHNRSRHIADAIRYATYSHSYNVESL